MEESAPTPSPVELFDQYADLALKLLRLKRLVILEKPRRQARLKQQLETIFPENQPENPQEFELILSALLVVVRQAAPPTMGEISAELAVPLSTATRIIDWLVRLAFVQRISDPDDRRIVRVEMTPVGAQHYQLILHAFHQRLDRVMAHFTPEEQDQLVALVRKLFQAVEAEHPSF